MGATTCDMDCYCLFLILVLGNDVVNLIVLEKSASELARL